MLFAVAVVVVGVFFYFFVCINIYTLRVLFMPNVSYLRRLAQANSKPKRLGQVAWTRRFKAFRFT